MDLAQLIAWFEANFACVFGWPMFCTGEGREPTVEELNSTNSRDWPGATRYIAYGLESEDSERGRRALVLALHNRFSQKLAEFPEIRGTRLYWRYSQKIELDSADGFSRIYTRIAVPALAERTHGLPRHEDGHRLRPFTDLVEH